MSMRRTTTTRRAMAAVSMTAALALALASWRRRGRRARQGGFQRAVRPSSPSAEDKGESKPDTAAGENANPDVKLAEARGQNGLTLVINQVKRDSGGFVTVQGEIKNDGDVTQNTANWQGQESALGAENPNSVAATLVDKMGKKRYYVLRDTDSRCLCTTAIATLAPGETASIFMQFPAPPQTTTEVDFNLPTFATTSLKISG